MVDVLRDAAGTTYDDYLAFVTTEIDQLGPRLGRYSALNYGSAVFWTPKTATPAAPIAAPTAPPLLLVAGAHDPATPLAGQALMKQALDNGSYELTYEGDGHAQFFLSACVRAAIGDYVVEPTTAPATASCPDEGK